MSVKRALFGLFFLMSMATPPVFAGVLMVCLVAAAICNLDIALERWGRQLSENPPTASTGIKLPSNICVIGLLLTVVFTVLGAFWGAEPIQVSPQQIHMWMTCGTIGLHICALFVFIGSMCSFVKLVD